MADAAELQLLKEGQSFYDTFDPEEESLKKQDEEGGDKYNVFSEFLKQLNPGVEIYRLAVPVFLLQNASLLEKLSIYSTPTSLMQSINNQQTPQRRMLAVVAWTLSTWRSIPRHGLQGCKPYNPILGEQFHCHWEHQDGSKTVFRAEQVSHHPPVSAFHGQNDALQFMYYGWVYPKTQFNWNSISTSMDGEFYVELGKFKERYTITHPLVSVGGLFLGTKIISVYDELKIVCEQTGVKASIRFLENNAVEGIITEKDDKQCFYIEGVVNKIVAFKDMASEQEKVLYNASKIVRLPKVVKPLVDQLPNESRRNWHKCTLPLSKENFEEAQKEKHIVEERERAIRKQRETDGVQWKPSLFNSDLGENKWRWNEYKSFV